METSHINFSGIGFENFKIFRDPVYFNFAPVTILTGTNNSGKSTVISGLRLLKHAYGDLKSLDSLMQLKIRTPDEMEKYGTINQFVNNSQNTNQFSFFFRRSFSWMYDKLIEVSIKTEMTHEGQAMIKQALVKLPCGDWGKTDPDTSLIEINETSEVVAYPILDQPPRNFPNLAYVRINFRNIYEQFIYSLVYNKRIPINEIVPLRKAIQEYYKTKDSNELVSLLGKNYSTTVEKNNVFIAEKCTTKFMTIAGNVGIIESFPVADDFEPAKNSEEHEYVAALLRKHMLLFDVSFLWEKNIIEKEEWVRLIEGYYQTDYESALHQFNSDMIDFFSEVNWINFDADAYFSFGEELKFPGYFSKGNAVSLLGLARMLLSTDYGGVELRFELKDAEQKYPLFCNTFISNLINWCSEVINGFHLHNVDEFADKNTLAFSCMQQYKHEIFEMILMPFQQSAKFNFVSTQRIQSSLLYSFNGDDEFSRLINNLYYLQPPVKETAMKFINSWLIKFGIAEKLLIEVIPNTYLFRIYLLNNGKKIALPDHGTGVIQLLPIILSLIPEIDGMTKARNIDAYKNRIVVLEEPEANLHPALQSKLADLFAEAYDKFRTQVLVETHSEYLIRRMQGLVVNGAFDHNNVNLYYFHHPENVPEGEDPVYEIKIGEDGALSKNFGRGFFDESANLNIALYNFTRHVNN